MHYWGNFGNREDGKLPWTTEKARGSMGYEYPAGEYTITPHAALSSSAINPLDIDSHHASRARANYPVQDQIPRSMVHSQFSTTTSIVPSQFSITTFQRPEPIARFERSVIAPSKDLINASSFEPTHQNVNLPEPQPPPPQIVYNSVADKIADFPGPNPTHTVNAKRTTKRYGRQEWEGRKGQIELFYVTKNHSLNEVLLKLAVDHFHPSSSALKRKVQEWGWWTYGPRSASDRKNPPRPKKRQAFGPQTAISSPSTLSINNPTPSKSTPGTVAVWSPQNLMVESSNLRLPPTIGKSVYYMYDESLIANVDVLYFVQLSKWKVHNGREVEEDEHDDLLVGIGSSLRDLEAGENAFAHQGIQKAFQTLKKVVGTKKSQDCGFFSLPAIWLAYLRLRGENQFLMAKVFLLHAIKHAMQRFGAQHPFVRALVLLQGAQGFEKIQEVRVADSQHLKHIVSNAYWNYIQAAKRLGDDNITYLQLWADFVVYINPSTAGQLLNQLRHAIRVSDEHNVEHDDYTLKLLGMILYVLQITPSMALEAEQTAMDLVRRLDNKKQPLEGEDIITWKDLMHTLGNFNFARRNLERAVAFMELSVSLGIVDGRDLYSLQKLEEWYTALGNIGEASRVKKLRLCEEDIQMSDVVIEIISAEDLVAVSDQGTLRSNSVDGGDGDIVEDPMVGMEQHDVPYLEKEVKWEAAVSIFQAEEEHF